MLFDYEFNEYEVNEGDSDFWIYTENDDGKLNLTGYNSTLSGELVIPNIINDKKVKNVNCTFNDNINLARLKVSYGIECLIYDSFKNRTNLSGEINLMNL